MATKNGLYSDRVKDILGDGRISKYKAEQTNQDIALTRDSVETLEEKTLIYQREMLKTALKQEDYLKKIAKNTHHSLFDRIGKLAENIGNIKHTFDSFRGNDAKRFGAQGLSGMCCCDGQGRRGRMGRTRRGGVSGGGSSTVADNIDDARVRGSGAGQGSGGSPRSRRRNARSTGYQTIRDSALLLQSKQVVKDWSKATSTAMTNVFKNNNRELARSTAAIGRNTAREAVRFTKRSTSSMSGFFGTMANLLDNRVTRFLGKAAAAGFAAYDFLDGRANAEDLVGRKLSNYEKTKAGMYNSLDNLAFGLPSMLTEALGGGNFTKYMSQQTPSMMENVQDLFGIGAKYRGITPDPINQQLGISERISRSFVDSYKGDPTKLHQELTGSMVQASLGGNLIPQSLRETINDVKQINRDMVVNQPVVDGVNSVQEEIKKQTKSIISNDSSNAKKSFTNDKDILNAIKKWSGYEEAPTAADPFKAPTGNKATANGYIPLEGGFENRNGSSQSDYQKTTDALIDGASQTHSSLFKPTSLGGGEWNKNGMQDGILPAGFSGKSGEPNIRLSTTGTAVGALGGGGQRGVTSQLIDDMLTHSSKPSPLLAKAIVGNMGVESAGTFDPNIKGDGGKALGLMQWHPDRQAKLEAYAKANKLNPRDRKTQALFAIEETVKGSPYADYGSVSARKKIDSGAHDLNMATQIFGKEAERPLRLSDSLADRQAWAAKADKNYTPLGMDPTKVANLMGDLSKRGVTPLNLTGIGATVNADGVVNQKQDRLAGTRKGEIDPTLSANIGKTVLKVLGEGHYADVFSGGQRMPGAEGAVGSRRHDKGGAGDLRIYDKNGNEISQENYAKVVQGYLAEGYGSAGLEMSGGGIHLDKITKDQLKKGESLFWNYNGKKNGKNVSQANLDIAKQGLDGIKPEYKMTDEQVARYMSGSDGVTPRVVSTSRELPRGDGSGMSALVNRSSGKSGRPNYIDSRFSQTSAYATSTVEAYKASVAKQDVSSAFDIPDAPSWSGSMGNETQANMVMAPPAQPVNIPQLAGIPNNADISDLLPLLYAEAVVK